MSGTVILDSTPLSLVTQRPGQSPESDACQRWLQNLALSGWDVYLPEITDYEVRRELTRSGKTASLARLDLLASTAIYLPIRPPCALPPTSGRGRAAAAGPRQTHTH